MWKLPVRPTPVKRPGQVKRVLLIALGIVVVLATTAAAPGPDASRAELYAYSFGSAVVLIAVANIVIKLFAYIVKAIVVFAALLALFALVKVAIEAVAGS